MKSWFMLGFNSGTGETPMAENPAFWSATRQAAAIRQGKLGSRQLLELYIARIEQFNPAVNAVVTTDFDTARRAADLADQAIARGARVGPLHGLPVTIKDALQTQDLRSTGGAIELTNNVPSSDAPVVAAVKTAGAIVMGKTNLPRWSGDIQAYNKIGGGSLRLRSHHHPPGNLPFRPVRWLPETPWICLINPISVAAHLKSCR
jgi:Asp-tRNA(Asn)/Glu-tRNA(Gln) amidotransferase A subunit family amidase